MSRFAHYTEAQKSRIKAIACQLIEGQIAQGKLASTEEAIRAAMPQAVEDARQALLAAEEFICG